MKILLVIIAAAVAFIGMEAVSRAEVNFATDVAPILVQRCLACHGEQKFKGEYQLHSLEALRKPGESGAAPITPGNPSASHLLKLLTENDATSRMPKDADPLAAGEIDLIRRWIAEGATVNARPQATLVNFVEWRHPDPPAIYSRPFPITAIAFCPNGQELAVGGCHEITIWSTTDGSLLRRIKGVAERTYSLAYSKDGARLCAGGGTPAQSGEVKLFRAADGSLLKHFGSQADCALGVAFNPDETRLAACGADSRVRVFNVGTGAEELCLKDHSDWVLGVAWSPDGSRLATAGGDKTSKIFDSRTGATITTYLDHGTFVNSVAFLPDGQHVVSGGSDKRIHRWIASDPGWQNPEKQDKKKPHQVASLTGFNGAVWQLVLCDGQVFACSADLSIRQFDLEKKAVVRTFAGQQAAPQALSYHADSKRLAVGGLDGQVRIWKIEDKDQPPLLFTAAPGYVSAPAAEVPSEK